MRERTAESFTCIHADRESTPEYAGFMAGASRVRNTIHYVASGAFVIGASLATGLCIWDEAREKERSEGPALSTPSNTTGPDAPAVESAAEQARRAAQVAANKPAALVLPPKKFRAIDLFGKTLREVEAVVGKKTEPFDPGRMVSYGPDEATDVLLTFEFENGKVARVQVATNAEASTEEHIAQVAAWMDMTGVPSVSGSIDAGAVEMTLNDALERANERKRVAGLLGDFLAKSNIGSGHSRGELETSFLYRPEPGVPCGRTLLTELKRGAMQELGIDFAKLGFREITCGLDGFKLAIAQPRAGRPTPKRNPVDDYFRP